MSELVNKHMGELVNKHMNELVNMSELVNKHMGELVMMQLSCDIGVGQNPDPVRFLPTANFTNMQNSP